MRTFRDLTKLLLFSDSTPKGEIPVHFFNASTRVGGDMKKQQFRAVALSTAFTVSAIFAGQAFANQTLEGIVSVGDAKVAQAKKSQERISRLQEETDDLVAKFKQTNKTIEGLRIYNSQLERQIVSQQDILKRLDASIADIAVIQRQIQPLVLEMLEGIEQFIELDAPYRKEQRLGRVAKLRELMDDADVTVAEKFRQVLEIYSIESEYARKIDTYEDSINVNGEELAVNIVAVGRIALMYQTVDGTKTGAWDKSSQQWTELDSGEYKKSVRNAIRIAQKKAQNDIMLLPIAAPEAAQ